MVWRHQTVSNLYTHPVNVRLGYVYLSLMLHSNTILIVIFWEMLKSIYTVHVGFITQKQKIQDSNPDTFMYKSNIIYLEEKCFLIK